MRDPDNLDFRPKLKSDLLVDGIGPYGKESTSHGGTYWIPGRLSVQASTPIPPNGTVTAKCDADLMWLAGYRADKHNLYLGTNRTAVEMATGPTADVSFDQLKVPANVVTPPGQLKPGVVYFWRVDALVGESVSMGDVWNFQCST